MNTWEDIYALENDAMDGWNLNTFAVADRPKYNAYRFSGTAAGACEIREIRLVGIKKLTDSSDNVQCPAKLHCNGEEIELEQVIYHEQLTPKIVDIHPNQGSVKGGELITIYGENFSDQKEDYEIKIDGVVC
jgi:hypothetical protein